MVKTVSYEIHSYKSGNWTIVGVQNNKAEAIHQARQLLASKSQQGVKVIEEKHDDETDRTTSAVVFTQIKGTEKKLPPGVKKKKKKKERVTSAEPEKKKKKDEFLRYLIILVLSVGGIALAVIAIGGFLIKAFG